MLLPVIVVRPRRMKFHAVVPVPFFAIQRKHRLTSPLRSAALAVPCPLAA